MPLIPSRLKWLSARVLAALPMLVSVCIAVLAVWYWQKPLMCMPLVLGVIAGGFGTRISESLYSVILNLR